MKSLLVLIFLGLFAMSFGAEMFRFSDKVPQPRKSSVEVSKEDLENLQRLADKRAAKPEIPPTVQTGEVYIKISNGYKPTEIGMQLGLVYLAPHETLSNVHIFKGTVAEDVISDGPQVSNIPGVEWIEQIHFRRVELRQRNFTDPLYPLQWHLRPNSDGRVAANVHSFVTPVWDMNITGSGVVIMVVDEGVEYTHPDLINKYRSDLLLDVVGGGNSPLPRSGNESHGTSVAGVALGDDDGSSCGIGAAFDAILGAVRLITGDAIPDSGIATALSFKYADASIYSNSWGPVVCQAGLYCVLSPRSTTVESAIHQGTSLGRAGKGAIYTVAAGNSRADGSNVNYQDLVRSTRVMPIAAYDASGRVAWYSDPGASLMVSAPSSAPGYNVPGIVTSDLTGNRGYDGGDCTFSFGGTSSSTPLVSGIIALMLQANPALTWRDVQDILARTSTRIAYGQDDWQQNLAGLWFSHDHGFGAINATAAVLAAMSRTNNLVCQACQLYTSTARVDIPDSNTPVTSSITVDPTNLGNVQTIEHVRAIVTIRHASRGQLKIELIRDGSIAASVLALPRSDTSPDYINWGFLTRLNWGESPAGTWSIRVTDQVSGTSGYIEAWSLYLFGPCADTNGAVCEEIPPNESFNQNKVTACFIATAAFGTPMDENVQTLRTFRDHILMNSVAGRKFVDLYYTYSPAVAKFISQSEVARAVTRTFLAPVVYFAQAFL